MRTNLILHFHCSECGAVLRTLYDEETKAKPARYDPDGYMSEVDREPTGALVRYVPAIMVEPCKVCIEKHAGPARRLAAALVELDNVGRSGDK